MIHVGILAGRKWLLDFRAIWIGGSGSCIETCTLKSAVLVLDEALKP